MTVKMRTDQYKRHIDCRRRGGREGGRKGEREGGRVGGRERWREVGR